MGKRLDPKLQIKETLLRNEKRLLNKINSPSEYKWIVGIAFLLFSFKKKFLVLWSKKSKKKALASITSDNIFGTKISYIDDFIVDRKLRWQWVGGSLFRKTLDYIWKKSRSDYAVLVTKDSRRASHHIYKKFGFKLVWLWAGYLAYKKMKHKK